MKKKPTPTYVRPTGIVNLNQHMSVFFHKATKRARAKDVVKRAAIKESAQSQ